MKISLENVISVRKHILVVYSQQVTGKGILKLV